MFGAEQATSHFLKKYSYLTIPPCFSHIVGICNTFLTKFGEKQTNVCYFLMYRVLPGGVFDGAPLTPPRGVVKSTWGNHQLSKQTRRTSFSKHASLGWHELNSARFIIQVSYSVSSPKRHGVVEVFGFNLASGGSVVTQTIAWLTSGICECDLKSVIRSLEHFQWNRP